MTAVPPEIVPCLASASAAMARDGVAVPPMAGKVLRPALAYALISPESRAALDEGFWLGALAVQMVHEASLLHDDILDGAETRRGRDTLVARRGVGAALVLGDQYLTGAYRAAARAGSPEFLQVFIEAVERTVAGEVAQGSSCGRDLREDEYLDIVRGKSGELFGAAAVLSATRCGASTAEARRLGCGVGTLYQMVDDFLDYCPAAQTGKEPYQDYRQGKHTFVLREAGIGDFSLRPDEVHRRLFSRGTDGVRPMEAALSRMRALRDRIVGDAQAVFGHAGAVSSILDGWVATAAGALAGELADDRTGHAAGDPAPAASSEAVVAHAARALGGPEAWGEYFGRHSKSFRFASLLFPSAPRADVEGVYAFCRFTDDLVDEADVSSLEARRRLEAWRALALEAYGGTRTDVPLLDTVMGRMRAAEVPFHYADELLAGVGMDLEPRTYATLSELEVYTYRVASVVGGWVTELVGLRDPALLARAFSLGHAMQLTNILRDVGSDWGMGRLYLPLTLLDAFGVTQEEVAAVAEAGEVTAGWTALMEHLMGVADRHYEAAFEVIPLLPDFYRRPVAAAARIYQGIHDEIRRNGYDNGTRRAHTTLGRKIRLAAGGLWTLRSPARLRARGPGLALAHQDT